MYRRIIFLINSIIWYFARALYSVLISVWWTISKSGVRIGRNVFIDRHSNLAGNNLINDNVRLISTKIGEYSYVSPNCILNKVTIGRYVSVGPGCIIGLGRHPLDGPTTSPYIYNDNLFKVRNEDDFSPVTIEADVWIGANSIIFGDLTIGIGAVVGAGSIVTKSVPPYAIVMGSPAKIHRYRFDSIRQQFFLKTRWWEMTPEEAMKVINAKQE